MTLGDLFRYSLAQFHENGLVGLSEAGAEGVRSARRRLRWFHRFSSSTRTVSMNDVTIEFQQQTVAEWDHIQAIRNERNAIQDATERTGSDDIVWDVGANVGAWSCFLAATGAEVVGFEPIQANQRALLENAHRNGLEVQVVPRALADETGDAPMVLDARGATAGAGRASLLPSWRGASETAIRVPTVRGDDLTELPSPTVLKVDVEGAEASVLRGMNDRLNDVHLLYVELHGKDDNEVYQMIADAGLTVTATPEETGCGLLRAERK